MRAPDDRETMVARQVTSMASNMEAMDSLNSSGELFSFEVRTMTSQTCERRAERKGQLEL